MFTLDDEDVSDGENEPEDFHTPRSDIGHDDVAKVPAALEPYRERERMGMRRFHALMELLTTEVGYLMDLRVLVTVSR